MKRSAPLLLLSLAVVACQLPDTSFRGHLGLVSPAGTPRQMRLVNPHVTGKACLRYRMFVGGSLLGPSGEQAFVELAVKDALAQAPGADALSLAEVRVEFGCYLAEGAAFDVD